MFSLFVCKLVVFAGGVYNGIEELIVMFSLEHFCFCKAEVGLS